MIQQLATPGVYVEEKNAFNSSITGIKTAIPAFIGYTEWIHKDGQSFEFQPIRITSINDYHALFGGRYKRPFSILPLDSNDEIGDFTIEGISYKVAPTFSKSYLLYNALRLFYANGGSVCYVVSIGKYKSPSSTDERYCAPELIKAAFSKGISCLKKEEAPTLVVIPEAVMMDEEDCFAVQQELLHHCGSDMKNRFALLDIVNGQLPRNYRSNDIISKFREGIGNNFLAYAACYYPFLDTTIVQQEEYTVDSIYSVDVLLELLLSETKKLLDVKKAEDSILEIYKLTDYAEDRVRLTQTLKVISPIFTKLLTRIRTIENCLPPSSALAGIYSLVDNMKGVWKAPANISLSSVVGPCLKITHEDQEDLNLSVTGKSINALRSFIGEGTLVWGARTLDGNSNDWRYINVRRTLIYIEQSIKYAVKPYVYESNSASTWVLIKSMISTFLNDLWKQGGLVGNTPEEAYTIEVGLGTTMTPNDILEGVMRLSIKVAISRPAEFIVLSFQQKMQES